MADPVAIPVDLNEAIAEAAAGPASVTVDGVTVQAQPLPALIQADRYLRGQQALAGGQSGWNCLRPARVVPPGAGG